MVTRRFTAIALLVLTACSSDEPPGHAGGAGGHGAAGSPAGAGGLGGAVVPAAGASGGSAGSAGTAGGGAGGAGGTIDMNMPDAAIPTNDASAQEPDASEPIACPMPALTSGDHERSVQHDGRERTYVMHVPSGYTGAAAVPLVFDFHGYGSSGRGQLGASGFRELSDEHGFIAIYPDGVGGSWHVNGCCGQAAQESLDEIGAVRAILADVTARICVDPGRIYASGISQGGGMAHHVGCLAADVFAAIAPVSSDLRTEPCEPARPVSELSFRGTADSLSAYEGGPVGPVGMQYQSIGAQATFDRWRVINECTGMAEPMLDVCETYSQCKDGSEVTLCSITGGGHVLYGNPLDFDIARTAWSMFERRGR